MVPNSLLTGKAQGKSGIDWQQPANNKAGWLKSQRASTLEAWGGGDTFCLVRAAGWTQEDMCANALECAGCLSHLLLCAEIQQQTPETTGERRDPKDSKPRLSLGLIVQGNRSLQGYS